MYSCWMAAKQETMSSASNPANKYQTALEFSSQGQSFLLIFQSHE